MLAGSANPIGIDWPMNAEVGKSQAEVQRRLDTGVRFALVYKSAVPDPKEYGKYGSRITMHVMDSWKQVGESENFKLYENPRMASGQSSARSSD
jgi:hypothetical protein